MVWWGEETGQNLEVALQREWLETDGLGGFASSTIIGCNTRRYHGLLVAATQPPVGRRVLLSKLEERLRRGPEYLPLSTNIYTGAVHPEGHQYLQEFRLDPWPVMTYRVGEVEIEKSVFMPHGLSATVVQYRVCSAPEPVWLLLRPLLACRDYHHLARASTDFDPTLDRGPDRFTLQPGDSASRVTLLYPGGELWPDGLWYYGFHYPREQERGLDSCEDLYSPGEIVFLVAPGEQISVIATTNPDLEIDPQRWAEQERKRRQEIAAQVPAGDAVGQRLAQAADQFLVRRQVGEEQLRTIIAGYPWFTDWGRDAMIAWPGLTLALRRYEEAAQVLRAFAAHIHRGLLPNSFNDAGEGAAYNTADASLWFVYAVRQYAQATRDLETVARHLYNPVLQVLAAYREGTDFGIGMDEDGLIRAGVEDTQLTWMDAKYDDTVFTPRGGKPVEINALWYTALRTGQYLAKRLDTTERVKEFQSLADTVRASFGAQFWNEERGYCYDCLGEEGPDPTLRPNQIIALALPYVLLPRDRARAVFAAVTDHLLTAYGLRSLAPFEPSYQGRYQGDQGQRDRAYHQGTVWPWLLGPYVSAYFWLAGVSEETRRHARELLQPLIDHLSQAGVGSISEIFEGDPPHAPGGCIAQAWSVAEVLRCWLQYRLSEV